jgi:hypothetical protein
LDRRWSLRGNREAISVSISRREVLFHTHQYGICFFARLQGGSWQRFACFIDRTASKEVRFQLELDLLRPRKDRFKNVDGLGDNLRSWRRCDLVRSTR